MKNLDTVAKELFNKIRGRFPSVTVGDEEAAITNKPSTARFFEFDFASGKKVNITLDEKNVTIMYSKNLFSEDETVLKDKWFEFLKELRQFAKKRMLNFDTRDITKSNLDKRDYEYLSAERQMSESKMYGTSRTSYQNVGTARMVVKHAGPINQEQPAGRTQQIHSIYVENDAGERFKYPYRHLNGARAMARHVAEGGNPFDDFGKNITGLSEELVNLRKFKTYMNRSSVMAEGLSQYMDVVNDRINAVKKTVESLQKQNHYSEAVQNFQQTVLEEVPEEVASDWTAQLTIKQFNEELKDVFPYIYKLVSEANAVHELGPEDLLGEERDDERIAKELMKQGYDSDNSDEELQNAMIELGYGKYMTRDRDLIGDVLDRLHDMTYGEDDGQPSSYDEYQDLYGGDEDFGGYDMESAYEAHLESIVSNAKHEKDPTMEQKETFEQYVNAQRWASALGESEFEFNGKIIPVNEKVALKENPILRALGKAGSAIGNAIRSPGARQGLDDIAGMAQRGGAAVAQGAKRAGQAAVDAAPGAAATAGRGAAALGRGVGRSVANNPGKYAIGGAGAYGYSQLPSMDDVQGAIASAGDTIASAPGDIAAALGDKLSAMVPNLDQIGAMAAKYALPVGLVIAAIWGGSKLLGAIFGDNEKESADDIRSKDTDGEKTQENDIPLDEFVKSLYDYTNNTFPKGETAVLTQVQKQYGDESVGEAQVVISELLQGQDEEMARIQQLAGVR